MHHHAVTLLGALVLVGPQPVSAPVLCRYQLEYSGGLNRIQVAHHDVTQETIPIKVHGLITIQLTDTVGGRTLDLLLESVQLIPLEGQPTMDLETGEGSRWRGLLRPDGRLVSVTAPRLTAILRPLDRYVRFFFRQRVGAAPGSAWVDTTVWLTNQGKETGSDRVVTNYSAPARERQGGAEVLGVTASWTGSRRASVPAGPEMMSIEGTSSGQSQHYYSATDACPLGGWRAGSSTQTNTAAAFGAPLVMSNHDSMAVTRLP